MGIAVDARRQRTREMLREDHDANSPGFPAVAASASHACVWASVQGKTELRECGIQ